MRSSSFIKWAIWVLISFGPTAIILVLGGKANAAQGAWLFLISVIVATAVANLDRVEELLVGPLKLKLREQIKESQNLNEVVRKQSLLTAKLLLSLVQRQGRMGGFPEEEKLKFSKGILDALGEVSEEEKEDITRDWHELVEFDILSKILGGGMVPSGGSQSQIARWSELRRFNSGASPAELRRLLTELGALDDDREALIVDLDYYRKNRKHRRLDVWFMHEQGKQIIVKGAT